MAQLDATLRALVDRGARELRLAEGARPTLAFPEGERAVSPTPLVRSQIVALVSELAPPDAVPSLASGTAVRFSYRLPEGRAFDCEAEVTGTILEARIAVSEGEPASPGPVGDTLPPFAREPLRPAAPEIESYLAYLVEAGASDLHLSPDEIPMLRLHGDLVRLPGACPTSPEETARLLFPMMPSRFKKELEESSDTDFAYEIPGIARFRCNVFADRRGVGGVFRAIPARIPTAEDLAVPTAVLDLCDAGKGLVLVTGPGGSGKSTTLAALIDHINGTRTGHIVTVEDPIEFVHPSRGCLVNQREVGSHTRSFERALRAALREDADVVLVGEMRDLETVAIALEAAASGHLVFGTLHTSTAASTLDRLIDPFPADSRPQIRAMLAESLEGVVSQVLLKRKGGGHIAAMEVLIGIPAVSNVIREGKTYQIPSIMQAGRKHGMVLMADAMLDLVRRDVVTPEETLRKAVDRTAVVARLKSAGVELAGASLS